MFLLVVILFTSQFLRLHCFELCNQKENFQCRKLNDNITEHCQTELRNISENCRVSEFKGSDNLKLNFGDVFLQLEPEINGNYLSMNIFPTVCWTRASIKFSEYNNPVTCKVFMVSKNKNSINSLKYDCYWKENQRYKEAILIEINSENEGQFAHKKILFSIPDISYFKNTVPPYKRQIFSYIDFTNANKIILKIQPLPEIYEVTHYKVEVFREKEKHSIMLDVRLIAAQQKKSIDFEYITYSEEGYYYFAISVVGNYCLEDLCYKTLTPKLHIARKGRPLVIGIVGASFLVPFILFSFYWWNHKYRNLGVFTSEPIQKVLILFKPCFEKNNEVVSAIVESIETFFGPDIIVDSINLTKVKEKTVEKFCSDNLILATHIVYVNPPYIDDDSSGLDYMMINFLQEEIKNKSSDRKLIVLRLPYSKRNVPSILSEAIHFDLIQDFSEFINVFSKIELHFDYSNNSVYLDLAKKIEAANREADILNNVPDIVVTADCDEPKEHDELI